MSVVALDAAWLAAHPLRLPEGEVDKNARGTVMAVGGSLIAPGAIRLAAEAALRAGAGKVRIGGPAPLAHHLAMAVPEAGVLGLPVSKGGDLTAGGLGALRESLGRCDTLVMGPGMGNPKGVRSLVKALLGEARDGMSLVLDAAAISCSGKLGRLIADHGGRVVMTPHHGEMAALLRCAEEDVAADDETTARDAAQSFGAVIVLKSARTVVAAPDGTTLRYEGGGVGLATGGSGDVLAGIAGGLLSRGHDPLAAAAWAVWLHGEAGRKLAREIGPIGFLARELLTEVPGLMASLEG
ncbi:NAD(P)H-hydrate dehydratase [Sphingomonas sp. ID0503]|uniref:NAD(P)H-hydrate dehydratase n=1 Tax=Sphingomonas sp. ID0503 TaxID=3399691 RepID=UPI003AFA408A